MKTKKAVEKLTQELGKDDSLYISYQANIAMAFMDEFEKFYGGTAIANKTKREIHQIANAGAKRFLDSWIAR